jgi:hypothetical protein
LIEGVSKRFPDSPHGFCMRHLSDNMKKLFANPELHATLWDAARGETMTKFESAMQHMRDLNSYCAAWLEKNADKCHWAKAFFPGRRYGHLTSNIAEALNALLLNVREKPIFSMMEQIRSKLMDIFAK